MSTPSGGAIPDSLALRRAPHDVLVIVFHTWLLARQLPTLGSEGRLVKRWAGEAFGQVGVVD